MNPVEIVPIQGTIILRARGSELLIMPQHVVALKQLAQPNDFVDYFRNQALINRPARKLFEAWLRKDQGLWQRIYKSVQDVEVEEAKDTSPEQQSSDDAVEVAKDKSPQSTDAPSPAKAEKGDAEKVDTTPKSTKAKKVSKAASSKVKSKKVSSGPTKITKTSQAATKKNTVKKAKVGHSKKV